MLNKINENVFWDLIHVFHKHFQVAMSTMQLKNQVNVYNIIIIFKLLNISMYLSQKTI